jgi:hypothetical protein
MLMNEPMIVLEEAGGLIHVFLDPRGDDHIVTKSVVDKRGGQIDTMLPHGSFAYERAVKRAEIAQVFCDHDR